jgi:hypothetical protein
MADLRDLVLNLTSVTASEILQRSEIKTVEKTQKQQSGRASVKTSIATTQVNPGRNTEFNTPLNRSANLRMAIKRSVVKEPLTNLVFESNSEFLNELGEEILAAFEYESDLWDVWIFLSAN